jgi:predicted permease
MGQLPPGQLAKLAQEDQGPLTKAIVITFTTIAFICVCLRFYTRITFQRNVGWEDYSIALSMVSHTSHQEFQITLGEGFCNTIFFLGGPVYLEMFDLTCLKCFSIAMAVCQVYRKSQLRVFDYIVTN